MPASVTAVLFATPHPFRLATFYAVAFGFEPPADPGPNADHVGVSTGGVYLGFDRVPGAPTGSSRATVWFNVDDAHASYALLLNVGAAPISAPDTTASPGETLATVADPEGNIIGLIGPD